MHISDGVLAPGILIAGYGAAAGATAYGLRGLQDRDYPLVGVMTAAFFVASLISVPVPPTSVHLTLNSLVGIVLGRRCFPAILIALLLQAILLQQGAISTLGVNTVMMAGPGYLAGVWLRRGLRRQRSGRLAFAAVLFITCTCMAGMTGNVMREIGGVQAGVEWFAAIAWGGAVTALLLGVERLLKGGPLFRWGFAAGAAAVLMSAAALFALLAFAPLDRASERDAFRNIARFAFVAHAPVIFVEGTMVALVLRYVVRTKPSLLGDAAIGGFE